MKKNLSVAMLFATTMITTTAYANVVSVKKDGTYTVDSRGAPIKVNNSRVPDELDVKLSGNTDRIKGRF